MARLEYIEEAVTYFLEVRDAIVEMGGDPINICMQCGTCSGTCPWGRLEEKSPFNIRRMIYMGRMGLEGFETDDILYACTTCNHCVTRCPRGVKISDVVRAMRSVTAETGGIPKNLKAVVGSINSQGNPWSQEREKRTEWTKDLNISEFTPETEYLLFVCCTSAYDGRSQKIARSIAQLLQKAGVGFGIIGNDEQCCGESVRKFGAEGEFSMLAVANIRLFKDKGVKKIITTSPHCFQAFKNDYPGFGGEFEIFHYTQILDDMVKGGKLSFSKAAGQKAIYHEPCYLGRHNKIFEAPRELLGRVPGLETLEYNKSKDDSLCCGGGGARIWMETKAGQRFSDIKVKEASEKGADLLVTACPYCVVMKVLIVTVAVIVGLDGKFSNYPSSPTIMIKQQICSIFSYGGQYQHSLSYLNSGSGRHHNTRASTLCIYLQNKGFFKFLKTSSKLYQ